MQSLRIMISLLVALLPLSLSAQCVAGDCYTGKGVYILEDGARYVGEFVRGQINGRGICYYPDGSRYDGQWARGLREGEGVLIYADGRREEGKWSENELVTRNPDTAERGTNNQAYYGKTGCVAGDCQDGTGTYIHPSGAVYNGDFKNGEIHGKGICYYPDGSKYQGDWANRYPDGKGAKTYPDGRVVSGYWRKGQPVDAFGNLLEDVETAKGEHPALQTGCINGDCYGGYGAFAYGDGSLYQGNFSMGKPHGQGTFFYTNNDQYTGAFQNGQPHGRGKLFKPDGQVVVGLWISGEYIQSPSGVSVPARTGCVQGNCRNGSGKYVYSNGAVYEGDFQNNLPHGFGTVVYANGDKYVGEMAHATFNGQGTLYRRGGQVYQGVWKDGKYVRPATPLVAERPTYQERPPAATQKPAESPAYTPTRMENSRESRIWAVVVGVSSYDHMPVLRYTDDDAYRMYAFLKSPEGGALADNQVRILVDEDATRENIKSAMRTIFGQAGPNDMILLYFSGHGLKDSFLPIDFNGYGNKLYHSEINDILKTSRARYKLCIADACHSGNLLAMKGAQSEVQQILSSYYQNLARSTPGTALIMSSKSNETSLESSGLRQGVFTHYLIRGLKGEANTNRDNYVSITELFNFVQQNVRSYTSNRQSPVIQGDYDYRMPVAGVRE